MGEGLGFVFFGTHGRVEAHEPLRGRRRSVRGLRVVPDPVATGSVAEVGLVETGPLLVRTDELVPLAIEEMEELVPEHPALEVRSLRMKQDVENEGVGLKVWIRASKVAPDRKIRNKRYALDTRALD